MNTENITFRPGDRVKSPDFGPGHVEYDKGSTVIVRFEHGIEECEKLSLARLQTPLQAIDLPEWHAPLEVITRIQAEAIQSVNDTWGVFSRSRIALLPHQLWVCRQALTTWPTRWLVADDVGLGKTIEAGLILWPLIAKGTVKRLLILCPASLVEQWQYRLRTMFDIRMARYTAEADTRKADFWNTHNQVIASLQTLRADRAGRHERLFESDPWDLLIVDEAHHLNADEDSGPTLGYKLVDRFVSEQRVSSIVFFTGTPHRGKDFGFLSLLRILRSDLFDPRRPMKEQLPRLREVMIRNNKQNVTDLKGQLLFQPSLVVSETYRYSEAEARFYRLLTEFITTGKTYASSLNAVDGRLVILVLISMQKLASSSVAAIRRALRGRLARIVDARQRLNELKSVRDVQELLSKYQELERSGDFDLVSDIDQQITELSAEVRLIEDEEPRLRELIAAAEEVGQETKVNKIISILENKFNNRQVLFFTEYKATQSLLMTALIRKYGSGCVSFINGDNRAEDIIDADGKNETLHEDRESASSKFNSGIIRFLVSTEAGGEGIDLQERCHSLIHVDLPWNPMRLHQRVGRLNRYGQDKQVEVVSLRNPDTVESLIWDKLNEKLNSITTALSQVMDEPEDLLQLVLGMTSPSLFTEVFAEAQTVPSPSLSEWFNHKTAQFGGKDAIETVRELVGHCSKFDFQQVSSQLPQVDLPTLRPFLVSMLTLNNRRVREDSEGLSFKTPEVWLNEPAVRTNYEGMIFNREDRSKNANDRIVGVGHKVLDQALHQARSSAACVASLSSDAIKLPLIAFLVSDRITGKGGVIRAVLVGVEISTEGAESDELLNDWELLERLNQVSIIRGIRARTSRRVDEPASIAAILKRAHFFIEQRLSSLDLPFKLPSIETLALLWPVNEVESFPPVVD